MGSCFAQVLAEDNEVVGVDPLRKIISGVTTTMDFSILKDCEVVFNVVNTPSKPDGTFDNKYLYQSIEQAKGYLNCKVFVIVSTVMPGTCEKVRKMLKCKVCYNPEFIRLNSIIEDMKNPDFVLIGEEDKQSGDLVEKIYRKFCNDAPIKRMDWKSAEIAKMALNSYITMKISFANVLDEICDRVGGDAKLITDAIGEDRRIGKEYFNPGGAYGGPCFPRDNRAFAVVAGEILNYSTLTDKINEHQSERIGFFSKDKRYRSLE